MSKSTSEGLAQALTTTRDAIVDLGIHGEELISIGIDAWGDIDIYLKPEAFQRVLRISEISPTHLWLTKPESTYFACHWRGVKFTGEIECPTTT